MENKRYYMLSRKGIAWIIVLCIVLSSAFGFGGAMLAANMDLTASESNTGKSDTAKTTGYELQDATGSKLTVAEITEKAADSVVEITTESVVTDSWMQQYVTEGAGSGVIIKDNGYIITNNHVVSGAGEIKVTLTNDKEYSARLVGADAQTDIAILKIAATDLTAATYGNSDQLSIGNMAVIIGNPLGELGGTVSAGIISSLDRKLTIEGQEMSLLQTDASINPGNSGGGMFNQEGQLIGIVVAKSSGSDVEGLGFAIPINQAAEIAKQLIKTGSVEGRVSTGMTFTETSGEVSGEDFWDFDFFGSMQAGVFVDQVTGSNAKEAGFKSGDQIYFVDNKEIDSVSTLNSIIKSHKAGDVLEFVVGRDGRQGTLKLKLSK